MDGRVIESDGHAENAQHVMTLDQERQDFGPEYHGHGVLSCWPDGRPPHPRHDYTVVQEARRGGRATRNRPARRATQLRHRWPVSWDAKIDWKALSRRIGHTDVAFTMKQYVQTDLEADRHVANTLAELIVGGSLASTALGDEDGGQHLGETA